jgi:hypothetical protein
VKILDFAVSEGWLMMTSKFESSIIVSIHHLKSGRHFTFLALCGYLKSGGKLLLVFSVGDGDLSNLSISTQDLTPNGTDRIVTACLSLESLLLHENIGVGNGNFTELCNLNSKSEISLVMWTSIMTDLSPLKEAQSILHQSYSFNGFLAAVGEYAFFLHPVGSLEIVAGKLTAVQLQVTLDVLSMGSGKVKSDFIDKLRLINSI